MSRDIKFRIWDKTSNTFIDNCLIGGGLVFKAILPMVIPTVKDDLIVQQFTGILDKNGKEIYEGDILKVSGWRGSKSKVEVKWESIDSSDDAGSNMVGFCRFDEYGGTEVIGNIMENPELIK